MCVRARMRQCECVCVCACVAVCPSMMLQERCCEQALCQFSIDMHGLDTATGGPKFFVKLAERPDHSKYAECKLCAQNRIEMEKVHASAHATVMHEVGGREGGGRGVHAHMHTHTHNPANSLAPQGRRFDA